MLAEIVPGSRSREFGISAGSPTYLVGIGGGMDFQRKCRLEFRGMWLQKSETSPELHHVSLQIGRHIVVCVH
jgi:hypothetical protein